MQAYHPIEGARSDVFVFADHASRHVPDWVGALGVSAPDMRRHIAYDIGSEWVARRLCAQLDCAGLLCGFSRLVIDANRDLAAPGLIPDTSDGTTIPANQNLSLPQREERIQRLYTAYHDALGRDLDARPGALAISVHSFTPQIIGEPPRDTDIGLLVKDDSETAVAFKTELIRTAPDLQIDINLPYSAHDLNFTVDNSVVTRGHPHLAIELRQDHIDTLTGAHVMADRIARAVRTILQET